VGGPYSSVSNNAIAAAFAANVVVVAAAGNEYGNACETSPASAPEAVTVGASNINDFKAGFSNEGCCLDIYAPGVSILSTYLGGTTVSFSGMSSFWRAQQLSWVKIVAIVRSLCAMPVVSTL
jgi:oryzin